LAQILPLEDEDSDMVLEILGASFATNHVLLLMQDFTLRLFIADSTGELEQIDMSAEFSSTKCISASVYHSPATGDQAYVFILTADGIFKVRAANRSLIVYRTLGKQ
jgi:hypothetical protein